MRKPDFENILLVLDKKVPKRPTLFEFFLNESLYKKLAISDGQIEKYWTFGLCCPMVINASKNAGYDYATVLGSDFTFALQKIVTKESNSLNDGCLLRDRNSFDNFQWPDPAKSDYSRLAASQKWLPDGMKLIVMGPRGVLENVLLLVGYESLCMMLLDDPELAENIFAQVGQRLANYYEICASYESVGALISNDDWGFKTQTMLSPSDMRKYVFPWHKKIVEIIHGSGKPAILHSCGKLDEVMNDIIYDMKYDGKHSYEDTIEPVEKAYERIGCKIAVLGGIDLDFVCRSTPQQLRQRCDAILKMTKCKGYALGTGNSVPEYVPDENFFAMIESVRQWKPC